MDNWELAYLTESWTTPDERSIYMPTDTREKRVSRFQELILSDIPRKIRNKKTAAVLGGAIGLCFGAPVPGIAMSLAVSIAYDKVFPERRPGYQEGDEILEYWYGDGRWEVTIIRNNRVLETRWNSWWEIGP
jgi:hypothetical protein